MSRNFRYVTTGLATVGLIVAGVVWWLGPNLLHLALLNSQRTEPFTVVSFVRGMQDEVYAARYQHPFAELVASEGGVLLDNYRQTHMFSGEQQHNWQFLSRLHLQQARDIARITTASPYAAMLEELPALNQTLVGSFAEPAQAWRSVLAMWLLQSFADDAADPMAPVLEVLELGPGRLIWDAQLTAIGQDVPWQRMVVVDFPSESQALAWLRRPEVATARAITNARVKNMALSVFVRDQSQTSARRQ